MLGFLVGCFDDEGNYDYKKVDAPEWNTSTIQLTVRAGETAKFRGVLIFHGK